MIAKLVVLIINCLVHAVLLRSPLDCAFCWMSSVCTGISSVHFCFVMNSNQVPSSNNLQHSVRHVRWWNENRSLFVGVAGKTVALITPLYGCAVTSVMLVTPMRNDLLCDCAASKTDNWANLVGLELSEIPAYCSRFA